MNVFNNDQRGGVCNRNVENGILRILSELYGEYRCVCESSRFHINRNSSLPGQFGYTVFNCVVMDVANLLADTLEDVNDEIWNNPATSGI